MLVFLLPSVLDFHFNDRSDDTREVCDCACLDQRELVACVLIHVLTEGESDPSFVRDLAKRDSWGFWGILGSSLFDFLFILSL